MTDLYGEIVKDAAEVQTKNLIEMEDSEFKIIKRFGPSVIKVKNPEKIIKTLNDHFDKVIIDKDESKRLNHGEDLVGDVTQELKLEKEIMEKSGWVKFLGTNIDKWMKEEIGKGITKFIMINSWIVRQYKNEYNPTHWHNGHISGAGYLKVPKTLGEHYQKKQIRDYRGGNLQLIDGSFNCCFYSFSRCYSFSFINSYYD